MSHVTGFALTPMTPEELANWEKALEWLIAADLRKK